MWQPGNELGFFTYAPYSGLFFWMWNGWQRRLFFDFDSLGRVRAPDTVMSRHFLVYLFGELLPGAMDGGNVEIGVTFP
jgi:hypothetical protein